MKRLIVAALLVASASSASAVMLAPRNARSCVLWLEVRATLLVDRAAVEFYMLGFLGGWQAGGRLENTGFDDPKAFFAWIDKECRDDPKRNPLEITETYMKVKLQKA